MTKIRYEIEVAGKWYRCKKAAEVNNGFLHYELRDATNGMARPGKWRKVIQPLAAPKPRTQERS